MISKLFAILKFILCHLDHIIACLIILIWLIKKWKACVDFLKNCVNYIRTIWFLFIFSFTLIYCVLSWSNIAKSTPIEVNYIMACFLLVLSLLPFIKSLKLGENESIINNPFDELKKAETQYSIMLNNAENTNDPAVTNDQERLLENVNATEQNMGVLNVSTK